LRTCGFYWYLLLEGNISLAYYIYLIKCNCHFYVWLFRVSKNNFNIIVSWGYTLIYLLDRIKDTDVYINIVSIFKNLKLKITSFRVWFRIKKGSFIERYKKYILLSKIIGSLSDRVCSI